MSQYLINMSDEMSHADRELFVEEFGMVNCFECRVEVTENKINNKK